MCFSCEKSGHSVTRCPTLDESFPFMLPGWSAEMTPGFIMILARVAARVERKTATDPGGGGGGGGSTPGSRGRGTADSRSPGCDGY